MNTKTQALAITMWDMFNMKADCRREIAKVEAALSNARMIHDDDPCVYHALMVQVVEDRLCELKRKLSGLDEWDELLSTVPGYNA